ncbi:MAG: helix-turn-helix domain-containing protein [Actinomycetota bacterium]|nr:helix-turn-helix domain-containing protein [Actinomycetota bacterium]
MPKSTRFSRLPKVEYLRARGCTVELMPTLQALSDHANNTTGLCWPRMSRMAAILGRSVRTVQRHVHELVRLGLVEIVERRRWRGRYSSYTFKVMHIVELIRRKKAGSTTGHGGPVGDGPPYKNRTRSYELPPKSPPIRGPEGARRRQQGYEWLFDRGGGAKEAE